MSEGALPVAEVGTREGETFTRHGCGSDFQRFGVLQHRLSERIIQSGCQKGICAESIRRQRQTLKNRTGKNFFVWRDEDSPKEIRKGFRLTLWQQPRGLPERETRVRERFGCFSPWATFAAGRPR